MLALVDTRSGKAGERGSEEGSVIQPTGTAGTGPSIHTETQFGMLTMGIWDSDLGEMDNGLS